MKIFILGGTGFIDYHATHVLLRNGHQVRTLTLPPAPPEDLLPEEVTVHLGDFNVLDDEEVLKRMKGRKGMIFAGGVDDRVTPKAPAYPFFYRMNVLPSKRFIRLACQAERAAWCFIELYFAYFDKVWSDLQLSKNHPYIRSRVELDVMILQLLYIFGYLQGRTPLWKPVLDYLHWPLPWVFYTRGGSAMEGVDQVAEAMVGELEGEGRRPLPDR